jgi:type IV pilus assembly protein PilX
MMRSTARQAQGGATLVVVTIFLVLIALMGISIATVSGLEERSAGNTRDRELAFNAAEAALADASVRLTASGSLLCNDAKVQTFAANDNSPSYWAGQFGTADGTACENCFTPSPALASGPGKIIYQPEYLIHKKTSAASGSHARSFVVTARATGGTDQAIVILQAGFTCDDSTCPTCTP